MLVCGSAKEDIQKRRAILIERREALAQAYAQFPYLTQTTSSTATLTPSTVNAKDSPVSRYPAHPNPIDGIHASMSALRTQHNQLTREITEARQMLVQELVDVFQIVEVGGRPALDVGNGAFGSMIGGGGGGDGPGARGKRGEWEIAGRLMCVPGDVGRTSQLTLSPPRSFFDCPFRFSPLTHQRRNHTHSPFPHSPHILSRHQTSF